MDCPERTIKGFTATRTSLNGITDIITVYYWNIFAIVINKKGIT